MRVALFVACFCPVVRAARSSLELSVFRCPMLGAASRLHGSLASCMTRASPRLNKLVVDMLLVSCCSGIFTGRSPKDKWIVKQGPSDKEVGWGSVNQPMTPEVFDKLYDRVLKHYETVPEAFVFDGFCGANKNSRRNVRIITELAWQHHFVTNMFIRPKSGMIHNAAVMFASGWCASRACVRAALRY